MIIDGKAVAEEIYIRLAQQRARIKPPVRLGVIVGAVDPAIESFVRIKGRAAKRLGVELVRADLPERATTEQTIEAVRSLSQKTDGIIVQLPLPDGVDVNAVLSEIPPERDVDGINPRDSTPRFVQAPVALAVVELLQRGGIDPRGKRTVIVGAGRLVGAPSALLLKELGADVSVVTLTSGSLNELKNADIIVSGAGTPGFIKPEHIKAGVALIDAGTSEQGGVIKGDADPACAEKAAIFTPVPGGVGPVAVAMIFKNLFDLVEKSSR
jgi:methylenetetrahydrofolate dehydrogenase (NADP+)/methenyltetrahydrofolate cyclohydrolase